MTYDESYARSLIARCQWTWAKTYISIPHEYIVRNRCGLSDQEFEYLVQAQREYGIHEQWHKYNFPYLYIDGYKYWTMGDAIKDTVIINRQKVFSEFDNIDVVEPEELWELPYNEMLLRFIQHFGKREVYEVGCGTGKTFEQFYLEPQKYRGIDPSSKAIAKFKASHPELSSRLFCSSFEESVNYWSKTDAVILATFGAASYFMKPYLKILAESGRDYYIMFYREGFCLKEFKQMHHFNYTYKELNELFPKAYFQEWLDYYIVSTKPIKYPHPYD